MKSHFIPGPSRPEILCVLNVIVAYQPLRHNNTAYSFQIMRAEGWIALNKIELIQDVFKDTGDIAKTSDFILAGL